MPVSDLVIPDPSADDNNNPVYAVCPLRVIGAGPAGMSLVLALCNRVAAAEGEEIAERRLLDSMRMVSMDRLSERLYLLDEAALLLQATGFDSGLPPIERDGRRVEVGRPTLNGELRDLSTGDIPPGLYGMASV